MEALKISAVALVGAILCIYLKKYREEYAMLISICTGVVIFGVALPYLKDFISSVRIFADMGGISGEYFVPMVKVVGISYITGYCSELCRDAGEGALAAKLEMAGKLILLGIALPVLTSLMEMILKIM